MLISVPKASPGKAISEGSILSSNKDIIIIGRIMKQQEQSNYIVNKIERIRKEKKLSQYRLAQRAEISQSSISNLLRRRNVPSIITLDKICNGLDITLAQFFSYEDEPPNLTTEQKDWLNLRSQLTETEKLIVEAFIQGMLSKNK